MPKGAGSIDCKAAGRSRSKGGHKERGMGHARTLFPVCFVLFAKCPYLVSSVLIPAPDRSVGFGRSGLRGV